MEKLFVGQNIVEKLAKHGPRMMWIRWERIILLIIYVILFT